MQGGWHKHLGKEYWHLGYGRVLGPLVGGSLGWKSWLGGEVIETKSKGGDVKMRKSEPRVISVRDSWEGIFWV